LSWCFWYQESLTRLEGAPIPFGRELESSDEGECLGPCDLGGSRTRGVVGEDSRGGKTQESIGRGRGATYVTSERIRGRIKASK